MDVRPVTLEGALVRLEPLSDAHFEGLAEIAFEPSIWRWMTIYPVTRDELRAWLDAALENAATGVEVPFATIERSSGRPIGSTRYLSIVPEHRRLEIGWTWVAPAWQRSGVNSEAKLLMLEHAFERLGAKRVEFKTDSNNDKSRNALLGIGAVEEGTLRHHMLAWGGRVRHSVYYSVVEGEWPGVREHLRARLARHPAPATS